MSMIPPNFLYRLCYPCLYVPGIPRAEGEDLLDLPNSCTLPESFRLTEKPGFAQVKVGWNEAGFGLELLVRGKERGVRGETGNYRRSDGISLWIDTRSSRESHRALRFCHHFYFLAGGAGVDGDSPSAGQTRIHRALADAPLCDPKKLQVRKHPIRGGYRLECFIPADCLAGFDVDLNREFGFFYAVRDSELGEQTLNIGAEFPYAEDPSLWQLLELLPAESKRKK
ncbi:MAG: hypothetical protein U0796_08810 [Gemmatales bacterium]